MALPFSQYVLLKKPKHDIHAMQPSELIPFFVEWVDTLLEDIRKLYNKNIIAKHIAKIYETGVQQWSNNISDVNHELWNITKIDQLYDKLIQRLTVEIEQNPVGILIPGNYPFLKNVSGVHMATQIILEENGNNITFMHQTKSESMVGDNANKETLKTVKTQFSNIPWLKTILPTLGKDITALLPNKPHAETIWFVEHSQTLVNDLLKNASFSTLPPLNDAFPELQLVQTPRLEIITSSTCCAQYCQHLFSALRLFLQQNNIYLPIVLYADSPYNDANEGYGSVHVINSAGQFVCTKVQCKTPHVAVQEDINQFTLALTAKENQDFTCLTLMGGFALIALIKMGFAENAEDNINPTTYIAPDAMIIYAADIILRDANTSPKAKKSAKCLIDALENMSMKVLTFWRMTFLEQLHWLLLSHRHPSIREHVRTLALETNISVITAITEHDFKHYDAFCGAFCYLWQHPDQLHVFDLQDLYEKMVHYFANPSHAAMPLGMMVGPLSMGMINRDPFFPPAYKQYLLNERIKLIAAECLEESEVEQNERDDESIDSDDNQSTIAFKR